MTASEAFRIFRTMHNEFVLCKLTDEELEEYSALVNNAVYAAHREIDRRNSQ